MNKAELIAKLADDAGITKTQANATLDSFVEAVTKTLKGGGKVTLVGFGTFSVSKRAARNGRNPQTGAVIKIKALPVSKQVKSCKLNYKSCINCTESSDTLGIGTFFLVFLLFDIYSFTNSFQHG